MSKGYWWNTAGKGETNLPEVKPAPVPNFKPQIPNTTRTLQGSNQIHCGEIFSYGESSNLFSLNIT